MAIPHRPSSFFGPIRGGHLTTRSRSRNTSVGGDSNFLLQKPPQNSQAGPAGNRESLCPGSRRKVSGTHPSKDLEASRPCKGWAVVTNQPLRNPVVSAGPARTCGMARRARATARPYRSFASSIESRPASHALQHWTPSPQRPPRSRNGRPNPYSPGPGRQVLHYMLRREV
jgi:hypothetical protein